MIRLYVGRTSHPGADSLVVPPASQEIVQGSGYIGAEVRAEPHYRGQQSTCQQPCRQYNKLIER